MLRHITLREPLMYPSTMLLSLLLVLCMLAPACMSPGQPAPRIDFYTLEYDVPVQKEAPLPVILDIQRFGIAPDYSTLRMVFKEAPYKRQEYVYHRWHADPADLVTSFLRRDFTLSNSFLAVSGPETSLPPTHILSGNVIAFYEQDEADVWQAVLQLSITLFKADEPDVTKRVLFQKCYKNAVNCPAKNPSGVAQTMSQAMKTTSLQILSDVTHALTRP